MGNINKRRFKVITVCALALLAATPVSEAITIYKCKINGVFTVSDRPCGNTRQLTSADANSQSGGINDLPSPPKELTSGGYGAKSPSASQGTLSLAQQYGLSTTPPKPHPIEHAVTSFAQTLGFDGSNFCACILKEMPGTQNDRAARAVISDCRTKFINTAQCPIRHPWFGMKTANACVIKYGKSTTSRIGARLISSACYRLYPRR